MMAPSDRDALHACQQSGYVTNAGRVIVIFTVIVAGSALAVRILGHFCGAGCQ